MLTRPATKQDYAWVAEIQAKCGLPIFKPNDTSWVLSCEKNEDACVNLAFCIWQATGDEREKEAELLSVAVQRGERGKGYGKAILEYSIKRLAEQGARKFFLEVREGNRVAISLYEKLGFEKISVRKEYYEGKENAVLMGLSIS